MGILTTIGNIFGSNPVVPAEVIKSTMGRLYEMNVREALTIAERWQPQPTQTTFRDEMDTRIAYLNGSMQADMLKELARRFPQTHSEIDKEQVNVRLYQKLVSDKAKIFMNPGEFFLTNKTTGERIEDSDEAAKTFAIVIKKAQLDSVLRDIDRLCRAIHRVCAKSWWDKRAKCARITTWPQQMVAIVPDINTYWDINVAHGVMLEMPGEDGLNNIASRRWEVWSKAQNDDGSWKSMHYIAGSRYDQNKKDQAWYEGGINASNEIPFKNAETGEPEYPITWWQDDTNLSLYWLGDESALVIPRMLNCALTDINHGMHFGMHPFISWKSDQDIPGNAPPVSIVGPGRGADVVGVHPVFTSTGFDPKPCVDLWQVLVELEQKISVGSANSLFSESGTPSTGYALQIKNIPLAEIREEMIPVYEPHVINTLEKLVMVHNTYAPESKLGQIDLTKYAINWTPGDIDLPKDGDAEDRSHAAKISANVETAIDWRMAVTGEKREQAEKAVEENRKKNKEGNPANPFDVASQTFGKKQIMDQDMDQEDKDEPKE